MNLAVSSTQSQSILIIFSDFTFSDDAFQLFKLSLFGMYLFRRLIFILNSVTIFVLF